MKIGVCFKTLVDLEKVIPSDWKSFDLFPDTSYVGTVIGYYDEVALELALRLRDQKLKDKNETITCIALTLGILPPLLAKKIYAAGFDQVVCLDCSNVEFAPKQVAEKLSNYLETQNLDVIITGNQTANMNSGMVPIYISGNLKIPIITNVCQGNLMEDKLSIEHETDNGSCVTQVRTPLMLSVGNSDIVGLRLATFKEQLAAGKREVIHIQEKPVRSITHSLQQKENHICKFIEGDIELQFDFIKKQIREVDIQ